MIAGSSVLALETLLSCVLEWPFIHSTSREGDFLLLLLQQWILSCIWSLVVLISVVWYLMILTQCSLVQFSSVAQSCLTLCNPMNCSRPGFPVHHQLPQLAQHLSIKSVMPSNHFILCHPLQSFPASGSSQMSPFFASGGQRFGASASSSILPKNIQD